MARENQGLQIALIVFVMLTLILGVTTFVFYRQWDQEKGKAVAADQEKSKVAKDLTAAQEDLLQFFSGLIDQVEQGANVRRQ